MAMIFIIADKSGIATVADLIARHCLPGIKVNKMHNSLYHCCACHCRPCLVRCSPSFLPAGNKSMIPVKRNL